MGNAAVYTVPAPRNGLNLIDGPDAPASLKEDEARELINLYPQGVAAAVRGGLDQFSSVAAGTSIRSLYSLPLADGTSRLLSTSNFGIQDITTGTEVDVTGTVPTSDDWTSTIFGHHLFLFNGVDTPQHWDGAAATFSDVSWTGVTPSTVIGANSYKERLWLAQGQSASAWYADNATEGVGVGVNFTEFPLSWYFKKGGQMMFVGSYTHEAATLADEALMFASSEGELLFYSGLYPGGAFSLIARFYIGKPLGYRAFVEVDNDTWIITDGGIYPVSLLFSGGPSVALNSIGRRINSLIQKYAKSVGRSHLWSGTYWQQGKRVYINIPTGGDSTICAVCNVETGGWAQYQYGGVSITSRCTHYGTPYVGDAAGRIFEAESNYNDNGEAISYSWKTPFFFFGSRNWKRFMDVTPLVKAAPGAQISIGIETDFKSTGTIGTITTNTGTYTPWGSPWGSPWSSSLEYQYAPASLAGQGHSGALHVQGAVKDVPLEFSALEVRFEEGSQR